VQGTSAKVNWKPGTEYRRLYLLIKSGERCLYDIRSICGIVNIAIVDFAPRHLICDLVTETVDVRKKKTFVRAQLLPTEMIFLLHKWT
jgi:hypothetical protein